MTRVRSLQRLLALVVPLFALTFASSALAGEIGVPAGVEAVATVTAPEPAAAPQPAPLSQRSKSRAATKPKNRRPARTLLQTTNCPLPGPKEAFHCVNLPLEGALFNDCEDEAVLILPGSYLHVLVRVTINLDGTVTVYTRSNFQKVAAIGSEGTEYQANDTQREEQTIHAFEPTIQFQRRESQELLSLDPRKLNQILHQEIVGTISIDPVTFEITITEQISGHLRCTGSKK